MQEEQQNLSNPHCCRNLVFIHSYLVCHDTQVILFADSCI